MNKQIYNNKEEEYRQHPGINVSKLKTLAKGVDKYKEELETEKSSQELLLGKVVDVMLTAEQSVFEDTFIVLEDSIEVPTEKSFDIVHKLYDTLLESGIEMTERMLDYEAQLIDILENTDWYKNRKMETRLESIFNYSDYFGFLVRAKGKTVITNKVFETATKIKESIKNTEATRKYFFSEFIEEDTLIFYQVPIYFELLNRNPQDNAQAKTLLDFVIVNTKNKTIRGGDLKTLSDSCINFKNNVISFRYDMQAAFYTEALLYAIQHNLDIFGIDLTDYQVNSSFLFVVESTKYIGNPVVYESDETVLGSGTYGRRSADGKYVYAKGYLELVDELNYVNKIDFATDKIIHENKNVLTLSL